MSFPLDWFDTIGRRNKKKVSSMSTDLEDVVFGEVISYETNVLDQRRHGSSVYSNTGSQHHGSFYLRIGAVGKWIENIQSCTYQSIFSVAFGVGSMIYSGLEFAQYFETNLERNCRDVLLAITPAARMIFTFSQMYFIFLNAKVSLRGKFIM